MDMTIPPLTIKIRLESDPLKSIMLVRKLAVQTCHTAPVRIIDRLKVCQMNGQVQDGTWQRS